MSHSAIMGNPFSLIVLVPLAHGSVLQVILQSVELDAVGTPKLGTQLIWVWYIQ